MTAARSVNATLLPNAKAQMAELVDACVSGAHAARCAGSSPVLGTYISGGDSSPNASAGGEIGIHATLRG